VSGKCREINEIGIWRFLVGISAVTFFFTNLSLRFVVRDVIKSTGYILYCAVGNIGWKF
jgi:hypothetical protein